MFFNQGKRHGGLFDRFHFIHRLAEEINTDLQTCRRRALNIALKLLILDQHARSRAAIAAAQDDILHTGIFDCVPVDIAVVFGNVNSHHSSRI